MEEKELYNSILTILRGNGTDQKPLIDLLDRYMKLWKTSLLLEADIDARGVSVEDPKTGLFKKNESVALLVNVNKQLILILNKLGIQAVVKVEDGKEL